MNITVLQKSARDYMNVMKERMQQRVIVNTKKREAECKLKQRFYYVQNKNDLMMTGPKKGNWNEKW